MTQLGRWIRFAHRLAPWSNPHAVPGGCLRSLCWTRSELGREVSVRVVEPALHRPVRGALLVLHGVHYLGPDDHRLDRFLHVLAEYGFLVAAPYLPDYLALIPEPSVVSDSKAALQLLRTHPRRPRETQPGVFSISFGSFPALRLAAEVPEQVGAAICFGGYADWQASMRFAIRGAPGREPDVRSHPVVYLSLIDHVDGAPPPGPKRDALIAAIYRLVRQTWDTATIPTSDEYRGVSEAVASSLALELREALMDAAGVSSFGADRTERAIARAERDLAWMDPRDAKLRGTPVPITIVHGRDDTVIPYEEGERLRRACPPGTKLYLTGFYGHAELEATGSIAANLKELVVLLRVLEEIVRAGRRNRGT